MKKALAFILCTALLASLCACGTAAPEETVAPTDPPTVATTEAPTDPPTDAPTQPPTTEAPTEDYTEEVKTLLSNVFAIDGFDASINVEGQDAEVILSSDMMGTVYSELTSGAAGAQENWDALVENIVTLCNTAQRVVEVSFGTYNLSLIVTDGTIPYISVENGEITLDMGNLGE